MSAFICHILRGRLDRDAAGIERDPLAQQAQVSLTAGGLPLSFLPFSPLKGL